MLQAALDRRSDAVYLEIGVSKGVTFRAIRAGTKLAVDPHFRFRKPLLAELRTRVRRKTGDHYFEVTSDEFFTKRADPVLGRRHIDVAFVDGLHEWRQALSDVDHVLAGLAPDGLILLHDCNPTSEPAAAPSLEEAKRHPGFTGAWNGDVYRAIIALRRRGGVEAYVLDVDQGLGVVIPAADVPPATDLPPPESVSYADLEARREHLLDLRRFEGVPA